MSVSTASHSYSIRLILNSALWLTAAGIVVRGCGAIKEMAFAAAFGVSRDTDVFLLAVTYSTFLPTVISGALATALIAQLARLQNSGTFPHDSALTRLAHGICITAVCTSVATYTLAPLFMQRLFGLSASDLDDAVRFARILAPLGFTMVVAACIAALLNSAKQFALPGISSAATPLAMLGAILAFGRIGGVDAAAWGMVAGGCAEVAILTLAVVRQRERLFSDHISAAGAVNAQAFWRSACFLALSAAIAAVSPMVDQIFLAKLEVGSITTFNYAWKVNSLLIGLFGTAFGVAIFPYLTDLAAQRNISGLKSLSWRIGVLVVPATAVASLLVFVFSHDIVQLLFARGNFTDRDTLVVADIQRVFAFQLVFYVAGLVAMRMLNAIGTADFVLWISCAGVGMNTLFDWLFYERLGGSGIALASVLTSVGSLIVAVLFIRCATRRELGSRPR